MKKYFKHKLENLINPQVMADVISAKVAKKIVVSPFAKIDNTLQGQAGDTVTVPAFAYIGDAVDVAEGNSITATQLTASSTTFGIKKYIQPPMMIAPPKSTSTTAITRYLNFICNLQISGSKIYAIKNAAKNGNNTPLK